MNYQLPKGTDMSYYFEDRDDIYKMSGKDRFGNYWTAMADPVVGTPYWMIYMVGNPGEKGQASWFLKARTPDEAIDHLIKEGKYQPR